MDTAKRLYDFFLFDDGGDPAADPPSKAVQRAAAEAQLALQEIRNLVESKGGTCQMVHPPVCCGGDVGWLLSVAADLIGVGAFLYLLGEKVHRFIITSNRHGNICGGDVNAIQAVAHYLVLQEHPLALTDICSVESLGSSRPPRAVPMQEIYLYRFRDFTTKTVFVVEVASNCDLVSLWTRELLDLDQPQDLEALLEP